MIDYNGDERRKDHACLHEGDIAVLKQFMTDTKKLFDKLQSVFIQNFVQLIIIIAVGVIVIIKMYGK